MRQNINSNPSLKLFESYTDFSGGLNNETSNEKLKDNEFPIMENVDLSGRGSAKRRTGRISWGSSSGTSGQGLFFYYRIFSDEPDMIIASSGTLSVKKYGAQAQFVAIPITDNGQPFTFQSNLPIEAVQYGDSLFIATGTKLVEMTYDEQNAWTSGTNYVIGSLVKSNQNIYKCTVAGTSGLTAPSETGAAVVDGSVIWEYQHFEYIAKTVEPYTPTVMEAIYIGTNGLADNPDAYVQDGVDTSLSVAGIKPAKRTGTVNQSMSITAYISKPETITSVSYKWEYKRSSSSTYTLGRDWTSGSTGKVWDFKVDTADTYDIKVTVRDSANTATEVPYVMSSFIVNLVETKTNTDLPVTGIQRCRKIMLHWDRLLLSLDDTNPYQMYISDLNNPRYFPVTNTIKFDTGKLEPITSIIRFQDMLIVFTTTTIQTLVGKSPEDYTRNLIHDGIGCIAGRSAQVVGNNLIFLSHEGIFMLKPNYFKLEAMNINRIDYPIKSEIIPKENACAVVHDSQYFICFPDQSIVYRLYYDNGMWVKDVSSNLNITQFLVYGNEVYEITSDSRVRKQDNTVYNDDGNVYVMTIKSKGYDLSASFNYKKLRRLYTLARHYTTHNVEITIKAYADSATVLDPTTGQAVVYSDGTTVWTSVTEPNAVFYAGTVFGSWLVGESPFGTVDVSVDKKSVQGKCRRFHIEFSHQQDNPCEIFGFGLEFKQKKP